MEMSIPLQFPSLRVWFYGLFGDKTGTAMKTNVIGHGLHRPSLPSCYSLPDLDWK
jgi:hypothetical protein